MATKRTTIVLTTAAALLLGCTAAGPLGAGREEGVDEVDRLRTEVEMLTAALAAAREELARAPAREEFERLEKKLEDLDDGAWDEAMELGIAQRFQQANTGLTPEGERRAAAAVVRQARAAALDPLLVAAVIEVESTYRAYAVSPVGAIGLMQVMPTTGKWLSEKLGQPVRTREQLFDPERNIELGVHYLAELQRQFGRLDLALLAYNAGPTRARAIASGPEEKLERWLDSYAGKVLAVHRRLQKHVAER